MIFVDLTPFVAICDRYWTDEYFLARDTQEGCQAWIKSFSTNVKGVQEMKRHFGSGGTMETNESDVYAMREAAKVSQSQFAKFIGASMRPLLNWARDRTDLAGPAIAAVRGCTLTLSAISNRFDPCKHLDRSLASAAGSVAN